MSGFRIVQLDPESSTLDAGTRVRVSQLSTLGDLKTLGQDDTLQLENTVLNVGGGTTTGTWNSNKYGMQMTGASSGSYVIRRSKMYFPYFNGKTKIHMFSFENFHTETNIVKRVGTFSSNNATPYDSTKDGIWLENDGTTVRFIIQREGVEVLNVPQVSWDNPLTGHDWSVFNVVQIDYLWLGGAGVRLFVRTQRGLELVHTYVHAGGIGHADVMIRSPNQPIRYEMRATGTATGIFTYICSYVASEGDNQLGGKVIVLRNNGAAFAGVTAAAVGTTYTLLAVKKSTGFRDLCMQFLDAGVLVTTADQLNISVRRDPTFGGTALSFSPSGYGFDIAAPTGALASTVTGGTEIFSRNLTQNSVVSETSHANNVLSYLGSQITDASDVMALCVTPISASVTLHGGMRVKIY